MNADQCRNLRWVVPTDHPAFAGHFPGRPIVPGVVLLDRALAAVAPAGQPCRIGTAKFFRPVGPGEALDFRFETLASGTIQFSIRSGEHEVAGGTLAPLPAAAP